MLIDRRIFLRSLKDGCFETVHSESDDLPNLYGAASRLDVGITGQLTYNTYLYCHMVVTEFGRESRSVRSIIDPNASGGDSMEGVDEAILSESR